jgi:tRNA-splicing ligase RtcB
MPLSAERDWKRHALRNPLGFYDLQTEDLGDVPVRLFLSEPLLEAAEPSLYAQIVNATRFEGTRAVIITPDVHFGYGVPVGCVIATDRTSGAVALGPVGFDMGCGMISAKSDVPSSAATPERRLEFNRKVMERVNLGTGGTSVRFGRLSPEELMTWLREGASGYVERFDRRTQVGRTERDRLPIDEDWSPPWGEPGHPERGLGQLGSLGGGNHFIELQRGVAADQDPTDARLGTLHVQIHTGSRGFGHGLATNYFALAKAERPDTITHLDLGYFLPESVHFRGYLNAVSAAANFAILNRLVIFEQVADAFERVFGAPLELVYEISHNLVQAEEHPEFGSVWVHRKGATRAFPAGHASLGDGPFASTGHPVLIPGSNRDESFILRPEPGSVHSLYSVNHGAGRRLSRGEALRQLDQSKVNETYRRAGVQVNDDGVVPLDESSQCYKRSNDVIDVVTQANLARIETRLWPLASIKGSDTISRHEKRSRRTKERDRTDERRHSRERKRGRED